MYYNFITVVLKYIRQRFYNDANGTAIVISCWPQCCGEKDWSTMGLPLLRGIRTQTLVPSNMYYRLGYVTYVSLVKRFGIYPFGSANVKTKCALFHQMAATIEDEKASIENDIKNRMEKTIENIRSNFNSIRIDKSNSAMLDKIEVEYYGSPVNLKSIAQISTPDANSLLVQPYDKSSFSTFRLCLDSLSECDHQLSQYSKLDPIPTAGLFYFSSMFGLIERM
ncbi:hypothetical protein Lal_00024197 [Lupinus albus]|nr:hypothetical protein Lal_00024197 [Lupinus albus]